uniref:DMRT like family A1 n=1 Tax=Ursus maritimus TaxID=29073 RepID=A0A452TGP5_URSMA
MNNLKGRYINIPFLPSDMPLQFPFIRPVCFLHFIYKFVSGAAPATGPGRERGPGAAEAPVPRTLRAWGSNIWRQQQNGEFPGLQRPCGGDGSAAQVALRRQQAQEESEARGLQRLLYPGPCGPGGQTSGGSSRTENSQASSGPAAVTALGLGALRQASLATPTFQVVQPDNTELKQLKESKCDSCQSGQEEPVSKSHQCTLGSSPKSVGVIGKQNIRPSISESSNKEDSIQPLHPGELSGGEESPRSLSSSDLESGNESEWARDFTATRVSLPTLSSRPRDPLDILTRIFPSYRRSRLEGILRFCKGDVVQAIEHVLNGKEHQPDTRDLVSSGELENPAFQRASNFSLGGIGFGTLGNKSAFSPLQTASASYGGDSSLYSLNPRLGINPLRLAYSSPGRGLSGFMSPYLTPGLVPALPFRPALDYAFSGMIRESSYLPSKDSLTSGRLYSRPNQDDL